VEPTPGSLADLSDDADPGVVARRIVVNALAVSPKTRHQLGELLARRGVPIDVANDVLDRFRAMGYIDDEAFAKAWVQQRHEFKGLSVRVLARELSERGVSADDQAAALDLIHEDDEWNRARELAARKYSRMHGLAHPVAMRRLQGFLARRGYSPQIVMSITREVMTGCDELGESDLT
jgi:regulatory protein